MHVFVHATISLFPSLFLEHCAQSLLLYACVSPGRGEAVTSLIELLLPRLPPKHHFQIHRSTSSMLLLSFCIVSYCSDL
jgi:hypothetical protein